MPAKRYNPGVGLVSCLIVAELAELLGRTAYAIIYKSKFLFDELIWTQLLV